MHHAQPNFHIWGLVSVSLYRSEPNSASNSRPTVYAHTPNFIIIGLLCRPPRTKNCNFGKFFKFGGCYTQPPLPIKAKLGGLEQSRNLRSRAEFCLICLFYCIWSAKNPKFFYRFSDFGILCCRQLARYGESWTRMHNCKPSPIQRYQTFLYSNSFMAKSYTETPSFKSVTDTQTNR